MPVSHQPVLRELVAHLGFSPRHSKRATGYGLMGPVDIAAPRFGDDGHTHAQIPALSGEIVDHALELGLLLLHLQHPLQLQPRPLVHLRLRLRHLDDCWFGR